ncbi:isoleucine--tRNA ligase [Sulfobacillus sp. hq2]|uniref:isoleucine--tRNA ligase n=2 Tax=Sulfobacillus TaxID=28033 RepID=UPI000CD12404|nr:isoleucine--tRNA ligase [Sulfobacillus sp. hq2]POB09315.1 isoleucine--tRNA ligase [Sulfobacillus sp. hq2]
MDYRPTLQLPKTSFPMKGNLPAKEPEWLAAWAAQGLYQAQREQRAHDEKFVLHDGPPYANGDIHTGTALNKILKDMINRYWTLAGYDVAYVPGWDTHGLPIEMRALKQLGVSQHQIDPVALRKECAAVARHYIGLMTQEFQRLGILGDWEHPYITMSPEYEGAELEVFAAMVEKGLIYRDLKPVYWCPHCETALAEGEIEYHNHRSRAIYVAFPVKESRGLLPAETRAVIWTTTPWTIPANVAIALHPDILYHVVETKEFGALLVAVDLTETLAQKMGWTIVGTYGPWPGRELEGVITTHPYLGHDVPLILGDHVTSESGTGLVHTAPGHGMEDFEAGRQYHLSVVQPLNDQGIYVDGTPLVAGLFYQDANAVVIDKLQEVGALLLEEPLEHQYAHCWRCKNPVIFRATQQWFMSIDRVREKLTEATYSVKWDPEWGGDRMRQMVENRQDWCLSRQRVWGVPIPAFYCQSCHTAVLDAPLIRHIAGIISQEGADSWWQQGPEHFLPEDYKCPECGSRDLVQEHDIFDVWLDSGSSQAAVLAGHRHLKWPADLVLEGNDQYRGWFNSLLTTAVAAKDQAPYHMVLTHGMVLDKSGQEMHKSLGNTIDPMDIVAQYGADILRLWVASSDYRNDVRISDEILRQLGESYRKIRNTFRFLLGNLAGFDGAGKARPHLADPLNRWIVHTVNSWSGEARVSYEGYAFHQVVHSLLHLVTTDLSSVYLDVIKDRLYTLAPNDPLRQETLYVLHYILDVMMRLVAPILVFTSDEVYQYAPKEVDAPMSVHLLRWPDVWAVGYTPEEDERMTRMLRYREVVLKALERVRADKTIGNALEGVVTLTIPVSDPPFTKEDRALLTEMTMAADIVAHVGETLEAQAERTTWQRCERCWRYTPDVGTHEEYPDLCERCHDVLQVML